MMRRVSYLKLDNNPFERIGLLKKNKNSYTRFVRKKEVHNAPKGQKVLKLRGIWCNFVYFTRCSVRCWKQIVRCVISQKSKFKLGNI